MAITIKAREGQWYTQRWSREAFCVIGIDEMSGVIDIRDADGDVDEVAFEEWERMNPEPCAPPSHSWAHEETGDELEMDESLSRPPNGSASHSVPRR